LEQHHHLIGGATELRPEIEILGGDANRAGIQMALADHLASHGEQREGAEAETFRPEQGSNHHVTPGAHTPVGFQHHTGALAVGDKDLMGLCNSQLPRRTCMFD
jgi:hypothetical protein